MAFAPPSSAKREMKNVKRRSLTALRVDDCRLPREFKKRPTLGRSGQYSLLCEATGKKLESRKEIEPGQFLCV